jgi:hypothetical protein
VLGELRSELVGRIRQNHRALGWCPLSLQEIADEVQVEAVMVPDLNSLPLPIFTLQPLDQFKQVGLRLQRARRAPALGRRLTRLFLARSFRPRGGCGAHFRGSPPGSASQAGTQ